MIARYFSVNREGHSIRCKLYATDPRNMQHVVIFGHGFGGHKDNKAAERFAQVLLSKQKGCGVVTFDWPCHGDDVKKKLRLVDCMTYIRLVTAEAREQLGATDICVYATSFGGYLFLKYMMDHADSFPAEPSLADTADVDAPFRKVVLRCPAVSMYSVLTDTIMSHGDADLLKSGKDVPMGFDRKVNMSRQFLEELKEADITKQDFLELSERILILHGTADEVVPFESVRQFADDNLIEFVPIEKADHRFQDPALMGTAIKKMIEFLFE
ncbi:MAG: alpha/beta hydrolase [Lachnospiraceae bacterium]|nr:alpha/beta hydrolase [Lachnospiraceae bacterium]